MQKQINEPLDDFISVRLSKIEKDILEKHLENHGLTKSYFVRSKIKKLVRTIKHKS